MSCTEPGIVPSSGLARARSLHPQPAGIQGTVANDDILQVRFASREAIQIEFDKNIANRGIFVATEADFEVRKAVTVEIVLDYVDASDVALALDGEIVHVLPKEMASGGAMQGVAVQFDATAAQLRERFEPLLGEAVSAPQDQDAEGERRRTAKRGAVRVPVRVMPTMSPPFEATSRDLSASGILLSTKTDVLPVGEVVRICLWHPSGEPSVEVDGKVVRQVPNKAGRIAAVAVAFDRNQVADPRVRSVIDGLREAGHRGRLGGISGSLVDLGLANILQMFSASAPQGTLVVDRDGEQGWLAFAEGHLLGAELGSLSGQAALIAMIEWGDGRFQFEASADPKLFESSTPRPLAGAILEAVCALDEAGRDKNGDSSVEYAVTGDEIRTPRVPIAASTTFEIDPDREAEARASLTKAEDAILELVRAGMSVERVRSVIPEPEDQIQSALEGLIELGVIAPR